jgi:putative oxidoreductase
LQRLFSTFADGWPGRGLLLQRVLTATLLFHSAIAHVGKTTPLAPTVLQMVGAVAGLLLLLGLLTPWAGLIVAAVELGIIISHPSDLWTPIMLAIIAATLAMIGPGALSIDARLFGRKQIEIPGR